MNTKKIIATLIAAGVISGGTVVGLQKPEKLTYDEGQLLIALYNIELQKNPVQFIGVTQDNLIQKLNEKLLKDTNESIAIKGEMLTAEAYNNLKRVMILKSEQKTNFEKILGL